MLLPEKAECMVRRFEIPGFDFSSYLISLPASVTLDLNFLRITSEESSNSITPDIEAADLLILELGS